MERQNPGWRRYLAEARAEYEAAQRAALRGNLRVARAHLRVARAHRGTAYEAAQREARHGNLRVARAHLRVARAHLRVARAHRRAARQAVIFGTLSPTVPTCYLGWLPEGLAAYCARCAWDGDAEDAVREEFWARRLRAHRAEGIIAAGEGER